MAVLRCDAMAAMACWLRDDQPIASGLLMLRTVSHRCVTPGDATKPRLTP